MTYKRLRRSAVSRGRSSASATGRMRTHFDAQHMLAAALFARKTFEIESTHPKSLVSGEPYHAHIAYVTAAVLSAVASLEATINEVFIDAREANSATFEGVDPIIPWLLATENGKLRDWEEIEKKATLDKYQVALRFTGKEQFNRGTSPYQEADSLIELRNALVHYKPEWSTNQRQHKKIEGRLKHQKFALNPFAGPNAAFFPKKCLGHGCAEWAVKSGVTFIEEFVSRLGRPSIFKNYPQELLRTQ